MDEEIWAAGINELYYMDIERGVATYYKLVTEEGKQCRIESLYTDGKQLYGLTQKEEDVASVVVRIMTNEIEENEEGILYMKVEEVTE